MPDRVCIDCGASSERCVCHLADPTEASYQPEMFGPGARSLLRQRPLFEGGMERGRKPAARVELPTMFE